MTAKLIASGPPKSWEHTQCHRSTNHFTTVWGDHVTVTETGLTYAQPYPDVINGGSIVIRNENHPDQTVSLAAKFGALNAAARPPQDYTGLWRGLDA